MDPARPNVVIIGAGFGGLEAAKALKRAPVNVTVLDRENYHLFQPLLYQVAMAELSGPDVSAPIRSVLARQSNAEVHLEEVQAIDLDRRRVITRAHEHPFDFLIVASGAEPNYFGHDAWEAVAPSPKSLDAALEIRKRVLCAYERAEVADEAGKRQQLLDFVVVGGGPTGVEFAGALADLSRLSLPQDFRRIDPRRSRIHLVEAGPTVLAGYPADLVRKAVRQLQELGVDVYVGNPVVQVDPGGVRLADGTRLDACTVIWAAGVKPTSLARSLPGEHDRLGRVVVERDLSLPGHPDVFAIGDIARFEQDGAILPAVSPVAIQQGRAAARAIQRVLRNETPEPFRYRDKGMLATIGRSRAVGRVGRLHLSGWFAWVTWALVHIFFLIDFRNRFAVLLNWTWSYFAFKQGARIITGLHAPLPEPAEAHDGPSVRIPRASDLRATPAGE